MQIFAAILWFILFLLLIVSFTEQTFLLLMKSKLFMLYGLCVFGVMSKIFLSKPRSWRYSLMFFLKGLILHFIVGCIVHFETIHNFLYKMWYLGLFSIISQEYKIIPTSFVHKTMLLPLLNSLCICQKISFPVWIYFYTFTQWHKLVNDILSLHL